MWTRRPFRHPSSGPGGRGCRGAFRATRFVATRFLAEGATRGAGARAAAASILATVVVALGGCIANSSNPSVVIHSATMDGAGALFDLELANPGGRDLTVTRLTYEVSHGESAFPLASGAWTGELPLPAGGRAELPLRIAFDTPPMEPDSRLLHLVGELSFVDRTGFMGIGSMDLTSTPFRGQIEAREGTP